jgi:hypothetical protein
VDGRDKPGHDNLGRSGLPRVEFFLMIAAIAAATGLMILACRRPLKGA